MKYILYGTTDESNDNYVKCRECENRYKAACPIKDTADDGFCNWAVKREKPKFYTLKDCPFCGKPAYMRVEHHTPSGWEYTPMCSDPSCAGRLTKKWLNGEQAANKWNSRTCEPITLESAIGHLQKIGWLQEHDRILTERSD